MPGGPKVIGGPPGPAMSYTGVVPVFNGSGGTGPAMPPLPETTPAGALATPKVTGDVLGLIGTGLLIFQVQESKILFWIFSNTSQRSSKISAASLSVCPSPSGSLGLRYHVKTRERRGSSFSQLGLEPNHTGLTAQSLFFLEELCRVKRSDTQTFSNYSK